jgi:hypothetical protein
MALPVHIPIEHVSRYSLLGAMASELADAFASAGCPVNPPGTPSGPRLHLFFNFPENFETFSAWTGAGTDRTRGSAIVQFFVDHPLALPAPLMDRLASLPNYRMLLPCVDDVSLLRLRCPRLRAAHCLHGVAPAALCNPASIASPRETDLVVAGSIHSEAELDALRAPLPALLHQPMEEMVRLMLAHPWMGFTQALDVCAPSGLHSPDSWKLLSAVWRWVTAALNRRRRVALVSAMQGVSTHVHGSPAWREHCTGTIHYAGETAYAELPRALASAHVCLAWGPTQFTHAFSERLLLAFAAGCAAVADDRLLVRRHAAAVTQVFDAANPRHAREVVDGLLRDTDRRVDLAQRGRALVERSHLWKHRLDTIASVAGDAMGV